MLRPLPLTTRAALRTLTTPHRFPRHAFPLPASDSWFTATAPRMLNLAHFDPLPAIAVTVPLECSTAKTFTLTPPLPLRHFLTHLSHPRSADSDPSLPHLYLAQTPLSHLPPVFSRDLPTPPPLPLHLRPTLWLGFSAGIHTPLHTDPDNNLFVQLCGRKQLRVINPVVGAGVVPDGGGGGVVVGGTRRKVGLAEEDFVGAERERIDAIVWGDGSELDGYSAELHAGDAVFIPRGWWHAVRGVEEEGVAASVNWWFR
jgi:hypothetical protein